MPTFLPIIISIEKLTQSGRYSTVLFIPITRITLIGPGFPFEVAANERDILRQVDSCGPRIWDLNLEI